VNISINNNTAVLRQSERAVPMANPSGADQFYLGGQNIPLGVALGISQAPFTVIDNAHQDGVFGFASPSFVATNSPVSVVITRTNGTFGTVQVKLSNRHQRQHGGGGRWIIVRPTAWLHGHSPDGDLSKSFAL
jgi:hypothetical protein